MGCLTTAFANTVVATFVVMVRTVSGKVVQVRKFKSTVGDLPKYFPMRDGMPVVGPNTYRELTFKEMVAKGIAPDANAARKMRENVFTYYLTVEPLLATPVAA